MAGGVEMKRNEKTPSEQTISCNHSAGTPGISSIIHSSLPSPTSLSLAYHTLLSPRIAFCHQCVGENTGKGEVYVCMCVSV